MTSSTTTLQLLAASVAVVVDDRCSSSVLVTIFSQTGENVMEISPIPSLATVSFSSFSCITSEILSIPSIPVAGTSSDVRSDGSCIIVLL